MFEESFLEEPRCEDQVDDAAAAAAVTATGPVGQ